MGRSSPHSVSLSPTSESLHGNRPQSQARTTHRASHPPSTSPPSNLLFSGLPLSLQPTPIHSPTPQIPGSLPSSRPLSPISSSSQQQHQQFLPRKLPARSNTLHAIPSPPAFQSHRRDI